MFLMCLGYGLVTFLTSLLVHLFLKHIVGLRMNDSSFTLGRWIVTTLLLLIVLGIANYYFMRTFFGPNSVVLLNIIVGTFIVGLFPIVFIGSMAVMRGERQYEAIATDLNTNKILAEIKQGQKLFDIDINAIRYIKSMQNYVTIGYVNQNFEKDIFRQTISALEDELANTSLIRCHRSYIVNLPHIEEVEGNAQGLRLQLSDTDEIVPVSRSYVSSVRNAWKG